jgi:acetyl esterase
MSSSPYRWPLAVAAARRALALPDAALRAIAGPPIERDGRTLNLQVQTILTLGERTGREFGSGSVEHARAELRRSSALGMPVRTDVDVSDRAIPGPRGDIRLRIYRPLSAQVAPPAIVFIHGGGWVVGDLDTHDGCARVLAAEAGCAVFSVDYRLAPEHAFPAAVDDVVAAYTWIRQHADSLDINPDRVGAIGDSAGGNLAAVLAQVARTLDVGPLAAQGLVYPATDFSKKAASFESVGDRFFLTAASIEWFQQHYLPAGTDLSDPRLSPLLTKDLSGLPPALVWTAGFDPLRDEGQRYAEALKEAGNEVRYRCFDDLVHGFYGMGVLRGGLARIEEMSRAMGRLMHDTAAAGSASA